MITGNIKGVEFVAINTDRQVLRRSDASMQLVIGEKLTNGFGAGANPQIGARAAEESIEDIKALLDGTDMVFITAGMGGGTGTGAAPVVARVAHEMDILTIGIVTKPFGFEGKRRMDQALAGIAELSQYVDSLVVIPNDRLKQVTDTRITLQNAFEVADGVLARGTQSISDLISVSAFINLDFADVCSVMKNAGHAHMGVGSATGKDKAELAAKAAISSPLLESSITGAHGILINITASPDVGLEDVDVASSLIAAEAAPDANVIWGVNFDNELEDEMRITIIATGFDNQKSMARPTAAPVAAPTPVAAPAETPKAAPKAEAPVKREKPKSSADEELDRLMKEFGTPKKKKINR
jgi:cell division protein FtsZ